MGREVVWVGVGGPEVGRVGGVGGVVREVGWVRVGG